MLNRDAAVVTAAFACMQVSIMSGRNAAVCCYHNSGSNLHVNVQRDER